MFYIEVEGGLEFKWDTENSYKPYTTDKVLYFEASGADLNYIRNNFINVLLCTNTDRVIWRGETAQFLYDNLR